MLRRFQNSWSLVKASAHVLRQDPELMIFPALSGLALAVVGASFFGLGVLTNLQTAVAGDGDMGIVGGLVTIVFYIVTYSLMFFFNSALVGAALIRLDGGNPTVADGFRIATERIGAILGYAVLAATVGMLVRAISERSGVLGRILGGIVGTAWSVATYLAVPVLVTRDVDPLQAVKESATLFRKTWGEQVAGNLSISLAFIPIFLGIAFLGVSAIVVSAAVSPWLAGFSIVSLVGAMMAAALVSSTLSTVYSAALYRYATTGSAPAGFEGTSFDEAFRAKRGR